MKKFWVILLSLGLIMAFAMPAAAVDVKFSGQYYIQGWYVDNHSALDKGSTYDSSNSTAGGLSPVAGRAGDPSWMNNANRGAQAFWAQRLRMNVEFQVVEGLKLVTRFDALEKMWGEQRWTGGSSETGTRMQGVNWTGNTANTAVPIQQNIEFERAYVDFNVPFGKFQAGYQQWMTWGTSFLNSPLTFPGIKYWGSYGPATFLVGYEARAEYRNTQAGGNGIKNDADKDVFDLGIIYKINPGEVGLLYQFTRSSEAKNNPGLALSYTAAQRNAMLLPTNNDGWVTTVSFFDPHAKLKFGNFSVEAEGYYGLGTWRKYEQFTGNTANQPDITLNTMGAYINAKYDWKPFWIGAQFVYMQGDEMKDKDKVTGSMAFAFRANYGFNRTLLLWNSDYGDNVGTITANTQPGGLATYGSNPRTGTPYGVNQFMDNVWFYQLYFGVQPTKKIAINAAFSYATADRKPKNGIGTVGDALDANNAASGFTAGDRIQEFVSDKYGTEFDITATYKIYDNLEYMIGAGYLWTGDYFKGYNTDAKLKDNYLLTHKLTLNF